MNKNGSVNDRNGVISGVSLPSFLQVLELEKNSCHLKIRGDGNAGSLFLQDGSIVDAETDFNIGLEAIYSILSWKNSTIQIDKFTDRVKRVHKTLTHILLDVARKEDEQKHTNGKTVAQEHSEAPQVDQSPSKNNSPSSGVVLSEAIRKKYPAAGKCLKILPEISGLRHYFILNRHGRAIIQSSENRKIADFITYCVVTGLQMSGTLKVKGPQLVLLTMENYEELLVIPRGGLIIGLLLEENIYIPEVIDQLQPVFNN